MVAECSNSNKLEVVINLYSASKADADADSRTQHPVWCLKPGLS